MSKNSIESAKRAIAIESEGMTALLASLDGALGQALAKAVEAIAKASGRVIVSGMGMLKLLAQTFCTI